MIDLHCLPTPNGWKTSIVLDLGKALRAAALDDEACKSLFGQTAQTLRDAANKTA